MRPKQMYLALCIVGTVLPYWRLIPFLREHGLDLRALFAQLFSTPAGGFFGLDVIISTVVLWIFVALESRAARMRHVWAPVASSLLVGVSLALPLFLYLREVRRESVA